MTRLFNDPATFSEDMLDGFLDANARYVVGVEGGVVRATETPSGKVAVVVGGGSGHYPAFCGVVGSGFADGAVVGNIFTSPSAREGQRQWPAPRTVTPGSSASRSKDAPCRAPSDHYSPSSPEPWIS